MATRFKPFSIEGSSAAKKRRSDTVQAEADSTSDVQDEPMDSERISGGGGGGAGSGGGVDKTVFKHYVDYPMEVKEFHFHCQYETEMILDAGYFFWKEQLSPMFMFMAFIFNRENPRKAAGILQMLSARTGPYVGDVDTNMTWVSAANMVFPYWKITNANVKFKEMQMLTQELVPASGTAKITTGPLGLRQQRLYIHRKPIDGWSQCIVSSIGSQTGQPPAGVFDFINESTSSGPLKIDPDTLSAIKVFPKLLGGTNADGNSSRREITTAVVHKYGLASNILKNSDYEVIRDIYPMDADYGHEVRLKPITSQLNTNYESHDVCDPLELHIGSMTHYTSQIIDPLIQHAPTINYAQNVTPSFGRLNENPWLATGGTPFNSLAGEFNGISAFWNSWTMLKFNEVGKDGYDNVYRCWPDQVVRQIPITGNETDYLAHACRNPNARGFPKHSNLFFIENRAITVNGDTVTPYVRGRMQVDFTLSICKSDIDASNLAFTGEYSKFMTYDSSYSRLVGAGVYGCPVDVCAALPLRTATDFAF